jgi:predicted amidohydrolase YtcJ
LIRGFVNGNIYVSFKPLRKAEALVVVDERVVYVGYSEKAKRITSTLGGEIVDLEGKTVLPGFIDSHAHLDELGLYLNSLDLRGVRSIRELKERLREHATKTRTYWISGHGWDQELFEEKRWPTRSDLDEVVRDRPVILTRVCLHAAVLNTKAMEITGLMEYRGPGAVLDDRGVPTGIVKEDACRVAREEFRRSLRSEDYAEAIERAIRYAASQGVTTVGFVNCNRRSLSTLLELWRRSRLAIRVRVYVTPDLLEELVNLNIKAGFGDDRLKIMGVKVVADGGLGARTAWLSEPYSDDPSTSGYPNISEEELRRIVRRAHEAGLQVAVHSIGDKTTDMILKVFSEFGEVRGGRHRVEHASVLRDDQIEKIGKLGIAVSVQPHFIVTDWWTLSRVGERRAKWCYPFKTMIANGIIVGLSTDSPVEPLNPWETVYAAVTRGKYEGIPIYRYTEQESLTLEEALHAYTWGSAYLMFEEDNLGSLEAGKLADFVVVDRDPFAVDERDLRGIKVLETFVGGKSVWKAGKD